MSAAYGLRVLNDRDPRWPQTPTVLDAIIRTDGERSARWIAEALWGRAENLHPNEGQNQHAWLDPALVSCQLLYREGGDPAVISPKRYAPQAARVLHLLRRQGLIAT